MDYKMNDSDITASMRKFHQLQRAYVLDILEKKEERTVKEQQEVQELLIQKEATEQIEMGNTTSLPIYIPLK